MIVTSFNCEANISLDSIVSMVNETAFDRLDYGQGSIFETDLFYSYYPDSFINKIEVRSKDFKKAVIDFEKPNIFYLQAPIINDIGVSLNNDYESFILAENKTFSKTHILEICLIKNRNTVNLFLLKSINKNLDSIAQINLSQVINFDKVAM